MAEGRAVAKALIRGSLIRRWREPAFGATPLKPYPANALLRWLLVSVFFWYAASGQLIDSPRYLWAGLSFIVAAMIFCEIELYRARLSEARLLRTWSLVLPLDVVIIMTAATLDKNETSPVPVLVVATLLTASGMFRSPYVLALSAMAALLAPVSHIAHDVQAGQVTFWSQGFIAAVIVGTGGFAALRSHSEEGLRRRLTTSEARERAQIARLREALEAARVSQARFEALSRHAPAIIALYDREARMTFGSRYLETALGVPAGHIADGDFWRTRIPPDELVDVAATIRLAAAGEVLTREFSVLTAAGEPRRMSGVFFPIEDGAGAIIQDVTSERVLTLQVIRAQQMETLGTLTGGIAHDFNNLLTTILGNVYLAMLEIPADSPTATLLADAQTAGKRGADLVRRLLEYSRPGYETMEPVSLARLIDETIGLAHRGLTPQTELVVEPCDPEANVSGNFSALQQVLLNLMVNARDAMPRGGRLTVSCSRVKIDEAYCTRHIEASPGEFHTIAVADTGSGIPRAALGRIFDPFFTTKEVGKGTGLGLSTAISILRAHGGWIGVESQPGRGSTFRVHLPVAAGPAGPNPGT